MVGCRVAMRSVVVYLLLAIFGVMPFSLSAQSRDLLRREALDSLVNPQNSTKGAGALLLSPAIVELGEIEGDEMVYFNFEVKNVSPRSVAITEFRSSCGCIRVLTKPQTIDPNSAIRVSASFNPAGRSSGFSYRVNIYTDLDDKLPTERVMVEGSVVCDDEWLHLPKRAGALRLSRTEVVLSSRGEERIVVANSGNKELAITAKPTIEGLSLRCEPKVLMPGCEGDIFITYRGDIASELNTIVILEGVEASPTDRMIKVKLKR